MKPISIEKQRELMARIGWFFDGCDLAGITPEYHGSKDSLGVSKIDFALEGKGLTTVIFTLRRPGLLIGKAGRTIDALEKHLSTGGEIVKIDIVEYDPWKLN